MLNTFTGQSNHKVMANRRASCKIWQPIISNSTRNLGCLGANKNCEIAVCEVVP